MINFDSDPHTECPYFKCNHDLKSGTRKSTSTSEDGKFIQSDIYRDSGGY